MKVYIKTFGCRVNQVESEAVLEQFKLHSHTITPNLKEADLCLLNTCSVTHKADRDADKEIRKILKENPKAQIIITGCYARAQKDSILKKFPAALGGASPQVIFKEDLGAALFEQPLTWTVTNHTGRTRAFVKIQDGCDCFCTYCIVPYTRPVKTSKPAPVLLAEITNLVANGYREIVLTGINIGNYKCPLTGADLAAILPEIFKIKGDWRLRFSSIEVNTITDAVIEACCAAADKFCPYLHIPLQSGSEAVLKHMGRRYSAKEYLSRLNYFRSKIKGLAVYCDIIAGYPTETEEDFKASLNFIEAAAFAGLHVFSYSARSGTPAAALKQLASSEIKKRADILRQADKALRQNAARLLIGTTQIVLGEELVKAGISGVSANFQRIIVENSQIKDTFLKVKVVSAQEGICLGQEIF